MANIKEQKLIYHLTAIDNLPSILSQGLLPRSRISEFRDVADALILQDRERLGLENFVPFHFFARNPFDGRVQSSHPGVNFVLIAVNRSLAKSLGWKIVPKHPLAGGGEGIVVMPYQEGFEAINWELMNRRDYADAECKNVCMAECLSPGPVDAKYFSTIFVKDNAAQLQVQQMLPRGLPVFITVNQQMFK